MSDEIDNPEVMGDADAADDGIHPRGSNPELSEAKAQVSELQARLRAVSAAYKQLQEDVEATKVRLERQAEFQRTMQRGESVAKMFDPLDNLKRSMDAIEDGDAKEGLKMVVSQFMGALEELGLEVLSPVGNAPSTPIFTRRSAWFLLQRRNKMGWSSRCSVRAIALAHVCSSPLG